MGPASPSSHGRPCRGCSPPVLPTNTHHQCSPPVLTTSAHQCCLVGRPGGRAPPAAQRAQQHPTCPPGGRVPRVVRAQQHPTCSPGGHSQQHPPPAHLTAARAPRPACRAGPQPGPWPGVHAGWRPAGARSSCPPSGPAGGGGWLGPHGHARTKHTGMSMGVAHTKPAWAHAGARSCACLLKGSPLQHGAGAGGTGRSGRPSVLRPVRC